jgi:hypothetical protein
MMVTSGDRGGSMEFAQIAAAILAVVVGLRVAWWWLITNNRRPCPPCAGTGDLPPGGKRTRPCGRCGGTGKVMTWFVRVARVFSTKAREKSASLNR